MTTLPPPPIRHGSYLPTDVVFLLTHINKSDITSTDPATKETLIQSGERHYSDMLTLESPVSDTHQRLYRQALAKYTPKMATDIARLARTLQAFFNDKVSTNTPLIIVSLVRAGVPVGVLLKRTFDEWQLPTCHYGVSIIRDRGLDALALECIVNAHPNSPIIFVDGWTGKGAIFGELSKSLANFCQVHPHTHGQFFHQNTLPLVVLADPAGVAWLSAGDDDWLMPSSLLNSTISGLISRTLWRADTFHGAVYYDELQDVDESLAFINAIDAQRKTLATPAPLRPKPAPTHATRAVIERIRHKFNIQNPNRIKPTIAEATRAVLRRDPERVLVTDFHDDTALLRHLCDERGIRVEQCDILPYQAMTIIKDKSQP
ncbi:MAG: cysteine protease StiP family protein [Moraxella sp.]|nr:cysteine protease StiP family protein [Moraxella sp.]